MPNDLHRLCPRIVRSKFLSGRGKDRRATKSCFTRFGPGFDWYCRGLGVSGWTDAAGKQANSTVRSAPSSASPPHSGGTGHTEADPSCRRLRIGRAGFLLMETPVEAQQNYGAFMMQAPRSPCASCTLHVATKILDVRKATDPYRLGLAQERVLAGHKPPLFEQVLDKIAGEVHQFVDRGFHRWSSHSTVVLRGIDRMGGAGCSVPLQQREWAISRSEARAAFSRPTRDLVTSAMLPLRRSCRSNALTSSLR